MKWLLLGGLSTGLAALVGQANPLDNPIAALAQFGVLGIMSGLYLLSHKREIDRLEKQIEAANARAEAAEARTAAETADSKKVRDAVIETIAPTMTKVTLQSEAFLAAAARQAAEFERLTAAILKRLEM